MSSTLRACLPCGMWHGASLGTFGGGTLLGGLGLSDLQLKFEFATFIQNSRRSPRMRILLRTSAKHN